MLVRSVASDSVYSVHTGYMEYDPKYPKIPCAAITLKTHKCSEECKIEGKILLSILLLKLNLFLIAIQTILFLKSRDLKSLMKSSLLVAISILGILDHKLEPMMMEEDLSLFLKHSEC